MYLVLFQKYPAPFDNDYLSDLLADSKGAGVESKSFGQEGYLKYYLKIQR